MPRAEELDVLCFGEVLVDLFPERPGLRIRDAERFERHLGGAPSNVAVGVARLDGRAGVMTLVGDDEFGLHLRAALAAEGVDTAGIGTHPTARTGITFVAVGTRGERSFLFYRHPSADQLIAEHDVDPALVARAAVFHYGSSTLAREPARAATRKALLAARTAGRVISCDPNVRLHLWRDPAEPGPVVRELLGHTHICKVADDELAVLTGTSDVAAGARALRELGIALAVITLGERGCYFDGAAAGTGFVPGERVTVVDTTGAGDGFVAGLLAHLRPALPDVAGLGRDVVVSACQLGNRVAAKVCTGLGATAPLPRRGDVISSP